MIGSKLKAFITGDWRGFTTGILGMLILMSQLFSLRWPVIPLMASRMIFLALVLCILYIRAPKNLYERISSPILCAAMAALIVYALVNGDRFAQRIAYVTPLTAADKVFAVILIAALLEGTRRTAGNVLLGIILLFLAYCAAGPYIPGALHHNGFSVKTFIENNVMTSGGIYGTALSAVISYVYFFLVFTAFLEKSGGGELFMNASMRLAGRYRGGAAKAGVIAAGAMGTISGSAVANVVGTGSLICPIMEKNGFDSQTSAATMAAAGTGGQLMPPIMGTAAFIIAESTGTPYMKIALAAVLPAFFYYFSIFVQVDGYAGRKGLRGLTKEELPRLKEVFRTYGLLMIPFVTLVYLIAIGRSVMTAALISTVLLWGFSLFKRETRMGPKKVLDALFTVAKSLPGVTIPCAAAGLIISSVVYTSLATKAGKLFIQLSQGNLLLSLLAIMVVCVILGMGMPTVSSYIIVSMLLVPTIVEMGVPLLAAHMFAFYFALLSFVTPPVAMSAYTAAGLTGADPAKTGWQAFKLTFAGFVVPFIFVFDQSLLFQGSLIWILWRTVVTSLGVWMLAGCFSGWLFNTAPSKLMVAIAAVGGIASIVPNSWSDMVSIVCFALLFLIARTVKKQDKDGSAAPA